jgi:chloramphenicol O-acetyltransferase type A
MKKLDLETWNRKFHFHFFKNYDNPFFSITVNIELTDLYFFTKKNQFSFFLTSLFASIKAANEIENFKYRIVDNEVVIHDKIDAGSTYLYDDNTFGFIYFEYFESFKLFYENGKKQIEICKNKKDMAAREGNRTDEIHYTVVPWVSFTALQHATNYGTSDSIPRIAFGKYFWQNEKLLMPVALEIHHSLVDGFHVGQYFSHFEKVAKDLARSAF